MQGVFESVSRIKAGEIDRIIVQKRDMYLESFRNGPSIWEISLVPMTTPVYGTNYSPMRFDKLPKYDTIWEKKRSLWVKDEKDRLHESENTNMG